MKIHDGGNVLFLGGEDEEGPENEREGIALLEPTGTYEGNKVRVE